MECFDDETAGRPVTLSPDDVRHAARLLALLIPPENSRQPTESDGAAEAATKDGLLAVARFSYLSRRARAQHFSPAMFGEPPWDVLLALYLKEHDGLVQTISSVAKEAGIAISTAFRWIDYLEKKRLIGRQPNCADGRASTVTLTQEGRTRLERYFAHVLVNMAATRDKIDVDPQQF